MKRITAVLALAPVAIWPTIEQIFLSAFFVLLTYGMEKLVIFIKSKIDKNLAVLPSDSSESL